MSLARLTAIVRTRYETGAYGDNVFRMATTTLDSLRARFPRAAKPTFGPGAGALLGGLLDIPVLIDEDVPDGTWQLAVRGKPANHWLVTESGSIDGEAA